MFCLKYNLDIFAVSLSTTVLHDKLTTIFCEFHLEEAVIRDVSSALKRTSRRRREMHSERHKAMGFCLDCPRISVLLIQYHFIRT